MRPRIIAALAAVLLAPALLPLACPAQAKTDMPPRSWLDKDTGHRVIRLSDVVSTPELAKRFNPTDPPTSKAPMVPAAQTTPPPAN